MLYCDVNAMYIFIGGGGGGGSGGRSNVESHEYESYRIGWY